MNFYAYAGTATLGSEKLGTDGRMLFELKTTPGAIRRTRRAFAGQPFTLYRFTNFYNNATFRLVHREGGR